jgi:hypothetical protein
MLDTETTGDALPTMTSRRYSEMLLRRSRGEAIDDLELSLMLRGSSAAQFELDADAAAEVVRGKQIEARLDRLAAVVETLATVAQHLLEMQLKGSSK